MKDLNDVTRKSEEQKQLNKSTSQKTTVLVKKPDGSVTLADKIADEKNIFKARPRLNSG